MIQILKTFIVSLLMLPQDIPPETQYGKASYYHNKFEGRKSANGSKFSNQGLTCATGLEYPFGTKLLVTNTDNGKSVIVTVTDRGSFSRKYPKRKIDLTQRAFRLISKDGSLRQGLVNVKIEIIYK